MLKNGLCSHLAAANALRKDSGVEDKTQIDTKVVRCLVPWEGIKTRFFADNVYVIARIPHAGVDIGERYTKVPKDARLWLKTLFGGHPISIKMTASGVERLHTYFILDCKTHGVPLGDALAGIKKVEHGIYDPETGYEFELVNADFTRNIPGVPIGMLDGEVPPILINNKKLFAKWNKRYVGSRCHTWSEAVEKDGEPTTYRTLFAEDSDETITYNVKVKGRDFKFYGKDTFHSETTTARGSTGNGRKHLLNSTHPDIEEAILDTAIQNHGFGRLEIRCNPGHVPGTIKDVELMLEAFWNATKHLRHSEPRWDCVDWFFRTGAELFILYDPVIRRFDATITRHVNTLTNNTNSENCPQTRDLGVLLHFLHSTTVPGEEVKLVWAIKNEDGKSAKVINRSQTITSNKWIPTPDYLPEDRRQSAKRRKGISNNYAKDVGLNPKTIDYRTIGYYNDFPEERIDLPPELEDSYNVEVGSQRKQKAKIWAKGVKKSQLQTMEDLAETIRSKPLSLRRCPQETVVNNISKTNSKVPAINTLEGRFVAPNHLHKVKVEKNTLYLFVKGKKTKIYKGKPLYANATLVPLTKDHPKYGYLLWDKSDFDKYGQVETTRGYKDD